MNDRDDLKLGVFVYDFEHRKSSEGILRLCLGGVKPDLVIAAPRKEILGRTPIVPNFIENNSQLSPKVICKAFGVPYVTSPHEASVNLILQEKLTDGLVLGARVLPQDVIASFPNGVINVHPGVLPELRGLDCVKHAVIRGIPQGVTVHKIGRNIDQGPILHQALLPSLTQFDTIQTINYKVQNLELKTISELGPTILATGELLADSKQFDLLTSATELEEQVALEKLATYLVVYQELVEGFRSLRSPMDSRAS